MKIQPEIRYFDDPVKRKNTQDSFSFFQTMLIINTQNVSANKWDNKLIHLVGYYTFLENKVHTLLDTISVFKEVKSEIFNSTENKLRSLIANSAIDKDQYQLIYQEAREEIRQGILKRKEVLLYKAAMNGLFDVTKFFIDVKNDVNVKNKHGCTPLLYAADKGYLDVVKLLVENSADVNEKDAEKMTSLMYASGKGHIFVVEFLIAQGALVNDIDNKGRDALSYAATGGSVIVAAFLLNNNADVTRESNLKWNPITGAAHHGKGEVVSLLLKTKIDFNLKDNNNKTALIYATKSGHVDVITMLFEAHKAQFFDQAMKSSPDMLDALLEEKKVSGADIKQYTMCDYLFQRVDAAKTDEKKMELLDKALENNAFGAFMRRTEYMMLHLIDPAVSRIEKARAALNTQKGELQQMKLG